MTKEKIRKQKAITLISLVITIIILLILSGISIAQLTQSGLFEKAKLAKEKSDDAQELENETLEEYESIAEEISGTREENTMQDFSINIKDILITSATIEISKTEDSIKAYVIFLNDEYKMTSIENNIIITGLKGETNYKITVVAIDNNYNSKKSETTFTTKGNYLIKEGKTRMIWKEYYQDHTTGTLTFEDGYISFNTGGSGKYSNYHTEQKIDITNYSTINFYGKINSGNASSGHFYISTAEETNSTSTSGTNKGLKSSVQLGTALKNYTIDIQNLTGEYYIGVFGSARTISIYDIWLE